MKRSIFITAALCVLGLNALADNPKISTRGDHTLLLAPDGTVKATGLNTYGQLGNGNTVNQSNYVTVVGLTNVTAVAAGSDFSLAISNGFVYAWGRGANGRLGNGSTANKLIPTRVNNLSNIVAIAAGGDFALAVQVGTETNCWDELCEDFDVTIVRRVWAWGYNNKGQLGIGGYTQQTSPVTISDFDDLEVSMIAAGDTHSVAFVTEWGGDIYTWGSAPGNGEDPVGWAPNETTPQWQILTYASTPVEFSAGRDFTLMRDDQGTVWGWGSQNHGELGDGTTATHYFWSYSPDDSAETRAGTLTNIVAISAGDSHSTAISGTGEAYTWGYNLYGPLGDGTQTQRLSPTLLTQTGNTGGKTNIVGISAGLQHTVALATNSTEGGWDVFGWGRHRYGQIGNGQYDWRGHLEPVYNVNTVTNWAGAVSAGYYFSLVLLSNQTLSAWGDNGNGQCGNGNISDQASPVMVAHANGFALTNISSFDAGAQHVLAISNGTVFAWGDGAYGELGNDASPAYVSRPAQMTNLNDVLAVSAGGYFSLAIKASDGSVWSWGQGASGKLGVGIYTNINGTNISYSYQNKDVPNHVTNIYGGPLTGFSLISAGNAHGLAVSNGIIWAWGANASGQLGVGHKVLQSNAVEVTSLSGVTAVSAGGAFSMALSNNVIYAWGENGSGQLGIGNTTDKTTPTKITSLSNVVAISAGNNFAIALKSDGTVWTWGNNGRGQLGVGGTTNRTSPTQIPGITNAVSVSAGQEHIVVALADGTVLVAGDTQDGQHGDGNVGFKLTPTPAVDPLP